jgi:hypothetical protein
MPGGSTCIHFADANFVPRVHIAVPQWRPPASPESEDEMTDVIRTPTGQSTAAPNATVTTTDLVEDVRTGLHADGAVVE